MYISICQKIEPEEEFWRLFRGSQPLDLTPDDLRWNWYNLNRNKLVSEVTQSCPTFCEPMNCSLPGSFVRGILQARMLEWVVISFPRASSWLRDWTHISCVSRIAGRFTCWDIREAPPEAQSLFKTHLCFFLFMFLESPSPHSCGYDMSFRTPSGLLWDLGPWMLYTEGA